MLAGLLVAGALLVAPSQADAVFRYTGAGGACHPANGGAAPRFQRTAHTIINNNNTDQYVICHFTMDDADSSPSGISKFEVFVFSATAGSSMACVAQTGSFYNEAVHIRASASRSYTFPDAGTFWVLEWDVGTLPREEIWETLTLSCKMGPGTRIGLITRAE